ncbi:MAG: helix-turn-helix domain-containing protein [Actinomycetota bacterium]|nr:helix-turn-helix domain-containing protein [Actinomycetota bacterium]
MSEFLRTLGAVLRSARKERGLKLKDVATWSGRRFAPTTVAGYEYGERSVSLERFCALARLYGVPPEELLGRALDAMGSLPGEARVIDMPPPGTRRPHGLRHG